MSETPLEERLRHPLARALAWLIGSPGLLDAEDPVHPGRVITDTWCADALADSTVWLLAQDASPTALETFIGARRITRLGLLAEALLAFWLMHCGRFELIAGNLAVRDRGRTLGAFDFVLRDRADRRVLHWEVAIKFYLRHPGLFGLDGYVGPGERDTLGAKANKVFAQQLGLGRTAQGRTALDACGVGQVDAVAFVKGRLFYLSQGEKAEVGVNVRHLRGWWRRFGVSAEWPQRGEFRFCRIDRLQWMAPRITATTAGSWSATQCESALARHFGDAGGAVLLARLTNDGGDWLESDRGFVTPAHWGIRPNTDVRT